VEWFGRPLALVRDLSAQIEAAHKRVMPDIPDLICHYHFLKSVGIKLCEKHYKKLTACLRRLKIRPALCSMRRNLVRYSKQKAPLTAAQIEKLLTAPEQAIHLDPGQERRALAYSLLCWLEDYGSDLQGEYFPFDLPSLALYRRYRMAYEWLVQTVTAMDSHNQVFPTLETIMGHLATALQDEELVTTAERLEKATCLFNELRDALRLSSDRRRPLLRQRFVANEAALAQQRDEHLQKWIDRINRQLPSENDTSRVTDSEIVLGYLQKYYPKLVGHVIVLNDFPQPFVVHRTNNLSEHLFGRTKQRLRRKIGTKNLARYVQAMRPEEFLVDNLRDPDYLQIICGGSLENLAAAFAQNWQAGQAIRLQRRKMTMDHPIPIRKKNLREDRFLSKLHAAVASTFNQVAAKHNAA
jgi:hypothetical protein